MGYLEDFQKQLDNNDFPKYMKLWEEYCASDTIDPEEFKQILESTKKNDKISCLLGRYIETAIPLWKTIQDEAFSYEVLRLLIDIETTNTPVLADLAFQALKNKYGTQPGFNEKIRLVGLRAAHGIFQGALSRFDLLVHINPGKFVFHLGGWGAGKIIEVSNVREQLVVEFENVAKSKDVPFINAFKTLIPISKDHFLARRFDDADALEKEAQANPVECIRMLLRDLGPKTAQEIKDELCDLVIPEKDWVKWWQAARAKVKKDTLIETPSSLKEPFRLRKAALSHEDRLKTALDDVSDIKEIMGTTYNFVRDFPEVFKKAEVKQAHKEKIENLLKLPGLTPIQELQVLIFLDEFFTHQEYTTLLQGRIKNLDTIVEAINDTEIIAFKKRILQAIRSYRSDWADLFLSLLYSLSQRIQGTLRDYILKELMQSPENVNRLETSLKELASNPSSNPEVFVWYFQKLTNKEEVPFSNKEGLVYFFEMFLMLLHSIESKPEWKDLVKRMHSLLTGKRYAIVRQIIEGTSLTFIKEFLLLVSKCHTFNDHDIKILRSLAEVVQPSLASKKNAHAKLNSNIIWTTEEGLRKIQERVNQIGTTEMVDNAREIETARAHGDLRENAEYKSALERRSRLQGELKTLSEQLNRARIITKDDINQDEIGVGVKVSLQDSQGQLVTYTILGPWDADPDKNILSFQTKLAVNMIGMRKGEHVVFRDEEYKIIDIKSAI